MLHGYMAVIYGMI